MLWHMLHLMIMLVILIVVQHLSVDHHVFFECRGFPRAARLGFLCHIFHMLLKSSGSPSQHFGIRAVRVLKLQLEVLVVHSVDTVDLRVGVRAPFHLIVAVFEAALSTYWDAGLGTGTVLL